MAQIIDIHARQIYDSRGNPTIQCQLNIHIGQFRSSIPSGASTGKYQALELRDNNPHQHMGKGVNQAINNVNQILSKQLRGIKCTQQTLIDKKMVQQIDGSFGQFGWTKAKMGANAILSVSLSICKASAAFLKKPIYAHIADIFGKTNNQFTLPCPAFNVINGGKHGGNKLAFQQFMIIPTGANSFREAMRYGTQIYHKLRDILKERYGLSAINIGDQGGFAPDVANYQQALQLINEAIDKAGYHKKISIAMDCAASQFYDEEKCLYNLNFKEQQPNFVTRNQLLEIYKNICYKYPVISIQDAFDQDDFDGWKKMTQQLSQKIQIVGDDLLVTNMNRIKTAVDNKYCNALLLKINQIGSLTQALNATRMSFQNNWNVMVSHRSGQTEDTFIADLAVGIGAGQIKTGAPCRSERLAKYNQLLRIQQQLGEKGRYAGIKPFIKTMKQDNLH